MRRERESRGRHRVRERWWRPGDWRSYWASYRRRAADRSRRREQAQAVRDRRAAWERVEVKPERPEFRVMTWHDFELRPEEPLEPFRPVEMDTAPVPDVPGPPVEVAAPETPCGPLERILHRQWDGAEPPTSDLGRAVDALAALPDRLKVELANALDGIYVGPGGVPDLDDMGYLRGRALPFGRATWDVCAGAYGDRKVVVGDRPSPTPDVMMHEIGHALDDIGGPGDEWISDSAEFRELYRRCMPHLVSEFYRQGNGLGRREFFADAFAAISSRQRPALVDMLGGDTRTALYVMLFFNRRYGI